MNEEQILKLYDKGLSLREIAEILNISHMSVKRALKQAGVLLRDTGRPSEETLKQKIIFLPKINYIVVVKGYVPESKETMFKFHCGNKALLFRNWLVSEGYPTSVYEIKDMRFWVNPETNKASKVKCNLIGEITYSDKDIIRLDLGKSWKMDLNEDFDGSSHDDNIEEVDNTMEVAQ